MIKFKIVLPNLNKIKGVHPGAILRRELKIQGIKSGHLANSIDEYKQTISAVINKRRDINPKLSIKLSKYFKVDEDYFMLLQASHDVKKISNLELKNTPNLDNIRKAVFWDTTFDKIDWFKNRRSVVQRILERGNKIEIEEIISFYGKSTVCKEIKSIKDSFLPSFEQNIVKYNLR